jgi:hypothetical protein
LSVPEYRIGEAAEFLSVSADTMRRWADAGRMKTELGDQGVEGTPLAMPTKIRRRWAASTSSTA